MRDSEQHICTPQSRFIDQKVLVTLSHWADEGRATSPIQRRHAAYFGGNFFDYVTKQLTSDIRDGEGSFPYTLSAPIPHFESPLSQSTDEWWTGYRSGWRRR